MDSSALGVFLSHIKRGLHLRIVAVSERVTRLLELVGLSDAFELPAIG